VKLIILVDELKYAPGIYGYNPIETTEIKKPIKDKLNSFSKILSSTVAISKEDSTTGRLIRSGAKVLGSLTPLGIGISGAISAGALIKEYQDTLLKNPEAEKGVWGPQQSFSNETSQVLKFITSSIVVSHSSISGKYKDAYKKNEFYGAFKNAKQMQKVLEADGCNSEIIIMPVDSAKEHFKHIGHGIFSPGKYIPHPKKQNVLLPFENFHSIILKEHDEELVRFFSSLGAKKIDVETIEGVKIDGSGIVPKKGEVKAKYESNEKHNKVYEFDPHAINVDSALEDKVWIQDFPKMLTFLETRKSFRLKRFEENFDVDTSFGIDLKVVSQFTGKFNWSKNSKYRYEIEFYSENELSNAA